MMLAGFNWIVDEALAGSGRPGLLSPFLEDIEFMRQQGISTVVTLTEGRVDQLDGFEGLESIHFPIPDMGFPTPRACADLCALVTDLMGDSRVLLHCRAGLGRTGTIAACCLVQLGLSPRGALGRVRSINPRYVQTQSQEQFIRHFAAHISEQVVAGRGD